MKLLRHLKAAWLYLRYFPYIDGADHPAAWEKTDEKAWSAFLESTTGRKMKMRLTNAVTRAAMRCAVETADHKYRAAYAAGAAGLVAFLESHEEKISPIAQAQESEPDLSTDEGVRAYIESLTP